MFAPRDVVLEVWGVREKHYHMTLLSWKSDDREDRLVHLGVGLLGLHWQGSGAFWLPSVDPWCHVDVETLSCEPVEERSVVTLPCCPSVERSVETLPC